ncbi:hypothetical protein ER308_00600 [Egibacter rhizosphaerae]|uniref:Enoyl-CoA hydratase n=1 Tax=Egibacter rhizosphaerae TaxID=1670831 RepID=A0A411YAL1_9ACTN|nr:enoyl-CoA hydratase-related protein [Egibacter rhizosphaerae]QBI18218.1 hypothetical protein ER308_00600 [Egibacter rhizosphaerae]
MPTDTPTRLSVSDTDGVTTITLSRPDKLNAIDQTMGRELEAVLDARDADPAVRAIILTGQGRGFCAGADIAALAEMAGTDARPPAVRRSMRSGSQRLAQRLLALETPLVAAVKGPTAGAGLGIAFAADVVLASEEASFAFAFAQRGLVPDFGVTFLLPRMVGLRAARELCLLGETVDPVRAERLGLVTRVVAADDLLEEANRVAATLARGPTAALGMTKRLLLDAFDSDAQTALDREFTAQAIAFAGEDAAEGAAAFREQRAPEFRGL